MTPPKKTSIKRKVMAVIMLASIAVLLMTVAAFMIYDLVTFRQTMVRNLGTQARMLAENSTADLAFGDKNDATKILASLRTEPHVIAAAFYDAQGKLFVKYPAQIAGADLPATPQAQGYLFAKSRLTLFQPVVQSGAQLGTLYLQSDLTALTQRLELYGAISLLIMLGSLGVAFWLSNTLQRRISNPIVALAKTARHISGKQDFSVRAEKTSDDELGDLTDAFNTMLNQIQTSHLELEKSRAHLQIVTDYAAVLLCHVDRHQIFHFVNPAYAARFGLTPPQLIGRHIRDIVGDPAYQSFYHYVERVLAGERVEFEKEIPYEKIGPRWMHCIYAPEQNAQGEVIGFVGVINDITDRKRAEIASRQLAAIVQSSDDAIVSKNLNSIIMSWNRGAERLFGYPAEEVIGRSITILMPPERLKEEQEILGRIRRGEKIEHYETIRQRKDGTLIEISLTVSPIKNAEGEIIGASKIARDISLQKAAERELERARDQALAAARAKDDFLAALSHELRTPLNPVLLVASDAATNPQLPPETRGDFEMIRRNVELEARLIDDLLDLTRITRGKLSLEKNLLDVRAVLQDAIAIVRADAEKKQIGLTLDFGAEQNIILGDAVRLQQIFWNVLKNAVKFTPDGGRIKIETRTLAENGNLAIKITDTGIGLTAAEISHIFDAFSQGEHIATGGAHRFGGLGLGLTISRMLAELHSGVIHVASGGRDQGATFTIEFPCARDVDEKNNPAPEPPSAGGSPLARKKKMGWRILLVEDHEPTRTALAHLLARRDYKVMAAASVAEARALAGRENFDLVVSDIGLPDGDGYALMSELRDNFGLKGIALTGYGMEQDMARSQNAGFIAHLTKPVHMESLEKVLAETI